ncbi:hypothetical protein [Blastococcus sp. LR1]|uniref:hypothetical protein n=1 Tax=Blastococcus sp. LR1 TaxID=2877000 RepID=UPI001CC9504C|nr:hypothetical protein [Blastococcus sp. LR1]MCA0146304.1 hypothetical protein [Blastococcus sp. LR1]
MSSRQQRIQELLERFWVAALILLVVCVGAGVLSSMSDWDYWNQPETEVTVTEVVTVDADDAGLGRSCRNPSELVVVDGDGRTGTLYDCPSTLYDGDTDLARWHPEEDRARNDVVMPGALVAICAGIYAFLLLILSGVFWAQRRSRRAEKTGR